MFTDRRVNTGASRRLPQAWPAERSFKILSLDGGGIRGIYTAELLRLCEQTFCNGRPIAQFFDLVAGTSTGGIIALGLGLSLPTDEISMFYRVDGRRIFPPQPRGRLSRLCASLRWFAAPRLQHRELEEALRRRFGDRLLGDSTTRLVIPAFMMPVTEIAVFKTDHHADYRRDHATPMWKVARATSAAPTYIEGFQHDASGRVFIDGGVWANNPTMIALVEALTSYDIQRDQIEILNVGTGNAPFALSKVQALGGLFAWREVIKAAMFLTTDNATAQAKLLLGPEKCLRIEPSREEADIELDDYDCAFRILPELAASHFKKHEADLGRFFANVVLPREKHY